MTKFSSSKNFINYTTRLKPITPIHIWSGINATIQINAFTVDDDIFVLESEDLEALPEEALRRLVSKMLEKPSGTEIIMREVFNYLHSSGKIKPIAKIKTASKPQPNTTIRLMHENLIPGSTLKGYIRTAIVRKLLTQLSPSQIVQKIQSGIYLDKAPQRLSEGLEASLLRKPRTRKQGGFFDAMELIKVSDPEIIQKTLSLRELRVVHTYDPGRIIARMYGIVLDPTKESSLRYKISVDSRRLQLEEIELRPWFDEETRPNLVAIMNLRNMLIELLRDKQSILTALREHGCYLINRELSKVHENLKSYRELLEDVKMRLCRENVDCAPARIGFMTGHEAKTVLDLVAKYTPDLHEKIVKKMQHIVGHTWDAMTLKLVDYDGKLLGVGWCELCIE